MESGSPTWTSSFSLFSSTQFKGLPLTSAKLQKYIPTLLKWFRPGGFYKTSTGSGDVDRETLKGYARTLIKAGDAAKEGKTEVFSFIILSFLKFTFP